MTEADIEQQIKDAKQHQKDGLITRKEMVRKIIQLRSRLSPSA